MFFVLSDVKGVHLTDVLTWAVLKIIISVMISHIRGEMNTGSFDK